MKKPLIAVAVAMLTVFAAFGFGASAGAQEAKASVTVIHGIPGVPVDVYVNGKKTLSDFKPDTVTAPIELAAGTYTVDIRSAGKPSTDAPLITGKATVAAGSNDTLIAHLAADGTPTLGAYVNDTAKTPAGQGRLVVRHTAAAPAVDVLAGGKAVLKGLTNPNGESLTLPAGTVSASVAAAGTTQPVIGPVDVPVVAGQVTVVYAIGSLNDKNLGAVVQTIKVGEEAAATAMPPAAAPSTKTPSTVPVPSGVPSGNSGLATGGGSTFPLALAAALGALAITGIGFSTRSLVLARRRS